MGGSSLTDVFYLLLLRCQVCWLCEKHNTPCPKKNLKKIKYTLSIHVCDKANQIVRGNHLVASSSKTTPALKVMELTGQ